MQIQLPEGITVFERGWLSSNNILFTGSSTALVDSGYCTHYRQTLALIESQLGRQDLDLLLNTHLHSDHCGGNAAVQKRYPEVKTLIPPGQASSVQHWDPIALTYIPTGQTCPPFSIDSVLSPGTTLRLGRFDWEVHAAPGHDANSIILFQPDHQVLIAADALWEKGFGVVFQELDGESAFDEVAQTLRLIERLAPQIIIPGHGRVFGDLKAALMTARARLAGFVKDPRKHAIHGAKVMLKFKLLEWQSAPLHDFLAWATATTIINAAYSKALPDCGMQVWLEQLINDLIRVGAATLHGQTIANAN